MAEPSGRSGPRLITTSRRRSASATANIDLVDCADRHIRVKREFKAKYAEGKI